MSNVANKYKLGVFVFMTITALIIIAILLGSMQMFEETVKCMTVVNSSVQGLSIGAKVKYNGVAIGQITAIKITPEGNNVFIFMTLSPDAIISAGNKNKTIALSEFLESQIKNGLCCQLRYEGITGTLYQEIKFFPPDIPRIPIPPLPENHPICLPSTPPILLGDIMTKINTSLEKLSKIDEILVHVDSTIETVNKYLEGPQVKSMLQQTEKISKNLGDISQKINDTITQEKLDHIVNNVYATVDELKKLSVNLNKELKEAQLPETLSEARKTMNNTNKKLDNLTQTIDSTAESIKELADSLNKQPDSLIWGKNSKKVVPTE